LILLFFKRRILHKFTDLIVLHIDCKLRDRLELMIII